jgi:hypothetical protein
VFDFHAAAVPFRQRADGIDRAQGAGAVERLRFARLAHQPVLAASLRAPDHGEPAAWSNPETGDHGEFVAVAGSFAREGQSCRAFVARLVQGGDAKTLQAVGCPSASGEVAVYDASPWTGL